MTVADDRQLAASVAKLRLLKAERDALHATEPNAALRRSCLLTLARLTNQIAEELSRQPRGSPRQVAAERSLASDEQVRNTSRKLDKVESLIREKANGVRDDPAARGSLSSLRRIRNKLSEEVLRRDTRTRQGVRAELA